MSSDAHAARGSVRVLGLVFHFAPALNSASLRNTKILSQLPRHGVDLQLITVSEDFGLRATSNGLELLAAVPADIQVVRTGCSFPLERLLGLRDSMRRALRASAPPSLKGGTMAAPKPRPSPPVRPGSRPGGGIKDLITYLLSLPDKYNGWFPYALAAALDASRRSRPDVIYAVGQPWTAMVVGCALREVLRVPLVLDFMDPWAARSWDEHKPRGIKRLETMLEALVVRRADLVIANTPELQDDFTRRLGLPRQKIAVATCGYDAADFVNLPPPPARARFVITHTGSFYGRRNPANFLRAVKQLIDSGRISRQEIAVRFLGRMANDDDGLDGLLADPALRDVVRLEGWVPHRAAIEALAASDLLLLLQPDIGLAVPAKLYEYVAARRPVLAIADDDGAVANLLRREGWGETVRNEDVGGIARAILSSFEGARSGREPSTSTWQNVEAYSVQTIGASLAAMLRSVCV